jgi:hypothetical protein
MDPPIHQHKKSCLLLCLLGTYGSNWLIVVFFSFYSDSIVFFCQVPISSASARTAILGDPRASPRIDQYKKSCLLLCCLGKYGSNWLIVVFFLFYSDFIVFFCQVPISSASARILILGEPLASPRIDQYKVSGLLLCGLGMYGGSWLIFI